MSCSSSKSMMIVDEPPPMAHKESSASAEDGLATADNNLDADFDSIILHPPPYQVDEKVFCIEHNNLYPAIIRKMRWTASASCWEFFVHYAGWNARWDQWRTSQELVPDSPEMKEKYEAQQRANQEASAAAAAAAAATTNSSRKRKSRDAKTSGSGGGNNNKRSGGLATKAGNASFPLEEYCELPLTLKEVLVSEWEKLTRLGWDSPHGYDLVVKHSTPARVVHELPAKVTVRHVLNHFAKTQQQKCENNNNNNNSSSGETAATATPAQIQEFCQGLLQLFETALPTCLLYKEERKQYEALLVSDTSKQQQLADVYGCEYLLRLLVKLPLLLQAETPIKSKKWVGLLLAELIVLLQKNRQAIFNKSQYRTPKPEEYLEWERSSYPKTS